jgi:transposase
VTDYLVLCQNSPDGTEVATFRVKETLEMPKKLYLVNLSDDELSFLSDLTSKGTIKVRQMKRALILLKAHAGLSDPQIMQAVNISRPSVERVRKRFVEGGLDKALREDPRPGRRPLLDGRAEAHLIATACSAAPNGHAHWTLRLLAGKLVELGVVETISHETVRSTLKKMS